MATAAGLGDARDARAWRRLFGPLTRDAGKLSHELLRPVVHLPRHPLALARFGLPALRSATGLARSRFRSDGARALFAGLAAHSMLPLDAPLSASFGLVLGDVRPRHRLADGPGRLVGHRRRAWRRRSGRWAARSPSAITWPRCRMSPASRVVIADTTPQALAAIAGDRMPVKVRDRYDRFRYGPGVVKVDWALDGPIPWSAPGWRGRRRSTSAVRSRSSRLRRPRSPPAGSAIGRSRCSCSTCRGTPARAPDGQTTAWAYCHVPNGSDIDASDAIEAQVERFAPGFRDRILARSVHGPAAMAAHDANYVGGDINAGVSDWRQLLFRPIVGLDPYHAGPGLYLASSSTPPGRRRPRHGRLPRRALRAPSRPRLDRVPGRVRRRQLAAAATSRTAAHRRRAARSTPRAGTRAR